MYDHLRFLYNKLSSQLWVRPLAFCLLAVLATFGASLADRLGIEEQVPLISHETVEKLLSIIAASMLGVATFAVGSMVAAYASVSSSATPRAFALVVSDDVSKTALSTFIAAFIFSVIALVAIKTGFYGRTATLLIFLTTLAVLVWVVLTFTRWVDQIARLGRIGTTIARVEKATTSAIEHRRRAPNLSAVPLCGRRSGDDVGDPLYAGTIGYVQHIDVGALQACAEKHELVVTVAALPGTFVGPGRVLAYLKPGATAGAGSLDVSPIVKAFFIDHDRTYDEDPRFGLIALSEIAGRALSPAVNDPGTAIGIIGTFVRLFALWVAPPDDGKGTATPKFDRVRVPSLALGDMFDDAFTAIARDGAGALEVVVRLQKAFISLSAVGHEELNAAARRHSKLSLARAELALKLPYELERVRALASKVT